MNSSNTSKNTLWDNEMINYAKKNMSKEDLERYQKIGESMFKDIDFETSGPTDEKKNHDASVLIDSVAYIVEGIKSGLHPSYLTVDEKNVMKEYYGEKWYEKYNYQLEDLDEIQKK